MENYFSITPLYKIWSKIFELIIPEFDFLIAVKNYRSGDIICNRAGIIFYFIKNDNNLEIIYSHPNKCFYCLIRNNSKEVIANWNKEIDIGQLNTIEDLYTAVNKLKSILEKTDAI